MTCPKSITVAGRPWRIKFVSQDKLIDLAEGDKNCIGLTYGNKLTVYVGEWLPIHMRREVLLHEVMHACAFGGRFEGPLAEDVDHEEHFVSGLDAPLLTTLRDNPALVAYLTA